MRKVINQGFNVDIRYLIPLCLIELAITIVTIIMPYKLTQINFIVIPAAALLVPIFYSILDVIAKVYGYKIARLLLWSLAMTAILFCVLTTFILTLPTAILSINYQNLYINFFKPIWDIISIGLIGWIVGPFINSYFISKWKILMEGKHFWLRSIGSTIIGEIAQITICTLLAFSSFLKVDGLINVIFILFLYKLISAIILSIPGTALVIFLKNKQENEIYDINTDFNPFRIA